MLWWWCCGGGGGGVGRALAGPTRELPYRLNMTELELLEHVLRNETEWRLVLRERVKNIGETQPYGDRLAVNLGDGSVLTADQSDAVDDPAAAAVAADEVNREYDPRAVVSATVPRFAAVGSMVSFAARVVHRAVACLAFRHLAFQAHYVTLLLANDDTEPAQVVYDLSAFRGAQVRVIDKLALVSGAGPELDLALDTYWDIVALLQEDAVHHVRPKAYPRSATVVANSVYRSYSAYVNDHCARPYKPDKQLFDDAGVKMPDKLAMDDVMGTMVRPAALVQVGGQHADFVQRTFYGLSAETLPRTIWTQLFYHARRLPPKNPLDRVNPALVRQPVIADQYGAQQAVPPLNNNNEALSLKVG